MSWVDIDENGSITKPIRPPVAPPTYEATDSGDAVWVDINETVGSGDTPLSAYDDAPDLLDPNSIFKADTWKRAGEGLGYASGVTGPIDQDIVDMDLSGVWEPLRDPIRRGAQIVDNIGDGVENAAIGALAGTDQLASDVTGFMGHILPDFIGFDGVSKYYQELADNRRAEMEPNSAVGAVAKELAYDAGMGAALGKGIEAVGAVGKGIGRWQNRNVLKRGSEGINELFRLAKDTAKVVEPSALEKVLGATTRATEMTKANRLAKVNEAFDALRKDQSMWPGAQLTADLLGKASPKTKKFIESVWDTAASHWVGGKKAATRQVIKMGDEAAKLGYTPKETKEILDYMINNPKIFEPLKDLVLKPGVNTNTVKLLGTGTAITSDVDDY